MRFGEIRELTNPFPAWQALPRLGGRGTSSDGGPVRGAALGLGKARVVGGDLGWGCGLLIRGDCVVVTHRDCVNTG